MRSEKLPLFARHLVVIQLHGVDGAAAELVVAGIRSENQRQQPHGPFYFGKAAQ